MPPAAMSSVHTERIDVRWGDMDALGHVNNSRYLTYFEQARVAWLGTLEGVWTREAGPVLARITCDFRRPITYPAALEVEVSIIRLGHTSLTLQHAIRLDGQATVVAEGEAVVVWIDYATGRPVPLPDRVRAAQEKTG